ncbi:hypothetical protein H6501_02775 [Candidatus Woesearchaeota archaeon]|nr:HxsD-like protein [Nanoarchaeota archaeon]MCB9370495.1 hypothetical protein [Candidatus Woesearchaeota archaeon]USN43573.1 MAG: hypothetical protein H6500_04220 [Candidatus Woesearchaeota archaeon]
MKVPVLKDTFAFLYLEKNIYSKRAIQASLEAYSEFVGAALQDMGTYTVVRLEPKGDDFSLDELVPEFLNFVLSEEYKSSATDAGPHVQEE